MAAFSAAMSATVSPEPLPVIEADRGGPPARAGARPLFVASSRPPRPTSSNRELHPASAKIGNAARVATGKNVSSGN
ncbi:MAG: hypothetical protein IPJ34_20920 [Myxococcales bacterium]|nr:hypothetical protein [Myxococcales bacterium]